MTKNKEIKIPHYPYTSQNMDSKNIGLIQGTLNEKLDEIHAINVDKNIIYVLGEKTYLMNSLTFYYEIFLHTKTSCIISNKRVGPSFLSIITGSYMGQSEFDDKVESLIELNKEEDNNDTK